MFLRKIYFKRDINYIKLYSKDKFSFIVVKEILISLNNLYFFLIFWCRNRDRGMCLGERVL